MATKSISDVDSFVVTFEADGNGGRTGTVLLQTSDGRTEQHTVNLLNARNAAATATGLSGTQVADAVREFIKACRAQARVAGGWTP